MRKKSKPKKQFIFTAVMIGVNILISCICVGMFQNYVSGNHAAIHEVALQGVMELANTMTRQLERYMKSQNEVLESTVEYIDSMQFTKDETINLMVHLKNMDGTLMLIDPETYQGYETTPSLDIQSSEAKETSIEKVQVLKDVCEKYKAQTDSQSFLVTDVYQNTGTGENMVAFYRPVTIEDKLEIMFYQITVRSMMENVSQDHKVINQNGVLLDNQGKVIYYPYGDNDIPTDNIYDFLINKFGAEASQQICDMIDSISYGSITQEDEKGNEWNYVFCHLGEDLGNSWVYLNCVQGEDLEQNNNLLMPIIIMLVCMMVPWLVNVIVIVLQNNKLRARQDTIEDKNAQLAAANKAQTAFISNMSHEIRTPINAILGMDEMIIRESSEEEIREYAYDIKNAGSTLLGIINDILDFTKIEAGKMEIIEQDYDLSLAVNDLINMINVKAKEKNLHLEVNLNPHTPCVLHGDELRIEQVILNILTNAVKYTEKGSVTFNLDYEKIDEGEIFLIVSVRDTGIGMKPEEMDKLLKPFERLDEKKNRTIEGTGLGMSIVASLLAAMDSKLEVESTYGVGSHFFFRIRQKVINWKEVGNLQSRYQEMKSEHGDEEEALFHASKANILVVDDTLVNLTVVKGLLKRTGARVDTAQSGEECLELCENRKYDIILLDHRMPQMDGVETLHLLREKEGMNHDTPVIALTANAVSGASEFYISEGFSDFLAKPVSGNKLEKMIARYLPKEVLDSEEELMTQINENAGIKASGSKEVYRQVCDEFSVTAENAIAEIRRYYESGDIENYTIKVHALKSTARLVGADHLSKLAKYLEDCGKEGRLEEIEGKTDDLLNYYACIAEKLGSSRTSKAGEVEISKEQIKEALEAVLEFSAAFDFDEVDSVMKQLDGYKMPETFEKTYQELKAAVYDVDKEKTDRIIQEYLERYGS